MSVLLHDYLSLLLVKYTWHILSLYYHVNLTGFSFTIENFMIHSAMKNLNNVMMVAIKGRGSAQMSFDGVMKYFSRFHKRKVM